MMRGILFIKKTGSLVNYLRNKLLSSSYRSDEVGLKKSYFSALES